MIPIERSELPLQIRLSRKASKSGSKIIQRHADVDSFLAGGCYPGVRGEL